MKKKKSAYVEKHALNSLCGPQFATSALGYLDGTAGDSCVHLRLYKDQTCGLVLTVFQASGTAFGT